MKKQLKQVVRTFNGLDPNITQMFDFSTNDSFLAGEYPVLNRAPDFNPSLVHSLTDSASSTESRESSSRDVMFPPFGPFTQKDLDDATASNLTPFLDPEKGAIDWAGSDMTGYDGTSPAMTGDFCGYEFPEIVSGDV